jgi:hypothetical protein
MASRV